MNSRFSNRRAQYKSRVGTAKTRAARKAVNAIVKRVLPRSINNNTSRNIFMRSAYGSGRPSSNYVDVGNAVYALDQTGSITLLNTVPRGAAQTERVGKRYTLKSLQHRGFMSSNSTATINDVVVMIVYDKRPTGSLPAITDILNASSATQQNKDDNVPDRFMILKRIHTTLIGNSTTPATGKEAVDSDFYMPMRLPVVCKNVGTGAIGDIEQGALYLVTVGYNVAGTTAASLTGTFRVRFEDTEG